MILSITYIPNRSAGYQLDHPALQAVFQRFDPTRSSALGLAEFLALTLFLRRSAAVLFCDCEV